MRTWSCRGWGERIRGVLGWVEAQPPFGGWVLGWWSGVGWAGDRGVEPRLGLGEGWRVRRIRYGGLGCMWNMFFRGGINVSLDYLRNHEQRKTMMTRSKMDAHRQRALERVAGRAVNVSTMGLG